MIPARRLSPAILRRLFFNARAACTTLAAICCQAAVCASPLSALLVGLGLVLSSAANAQTAHFIDAEATVRGGLSNPFQVVIDASGKIYLTNSGANQVLIETPTLGGYSETTIGAGLNQPQGVAVDLQGNVYIADTENHRVLKETLSGGDYSQSVIGSGFELPSSIAVDASGNLFITEDEYGTVVKETVFGSALVQSTAVTGLNYPTDIAVDSSGNLYIADTNNARVLKEKPSGSGYIQSTLGSGFGTPVGLALDQKGNIYIADSYPAKIWKLTVSGSTYTQSQLPEVSYLGGPSGITVDTAGNIYIADQDGLESSNQGKLYEEMPAGGSFGPVIVGTTSPEIYLLFQFDTPGVLGNVDVVTQGAENLDFINTGELSCIPTFSFTAGQTCATTVALKPAVAGYRYGAVKLEDNSGNTFATGFVSGNGVGPQAIYQVSGEPSTQKLVPYSSAGQSSPYAIAVDATGSVYIADSNNNRVLKESLSGSTYTESVIGSGLDSPAQVAVDGRGNVYIADSGNGRVVKESLNAGVYTQTTISSGYSSPNGVAVDANGNVYVADTLNDRVLKLTLSGNSYTQTVLPASGLSTVFGVAVDGAGNVYIADTGNQRIVKETLSGSTYTQSLVNSGLDDPFTIAVDGLGDIFFVQFYQNYIIEEVPAAGGGYVSERSPSPALSAPYGIAVDGLGNVYVSDVGSEQVYKEDYADAPSLTFDSTNVGSASADTPIYVALINIGNVPMFFPIPMTGTNPSVAANFTLDSSVSSSCPLVPAGAKGTNLLDAGASCLLAIGFSPTAEGTLTGSIAVTDNSLLASGPGYATQSISLTGTGLGPQVSLSATSEAFGNQQVGTASASKYIVLTNTGATPLAITSIALTGTNASSFVFVNSCGSSLAAGANCSIHGHFGPTTTGALTAAITITDNASNSPQTIALSGTGVQPPVTLSATSLTFPTTTVGSASSSQSVTMTNTGTTALSITSIAVTGTNASSFEFANSCGTNLAAGANCTIHGHFAPAAGGVLKAAITITDNAATSPQSVTLSGTGVEPPVSLSATSLAFGSVNVGSVSASQSVTLSNNGTTALSIASIAVTGTAASSFDFANSCGASLAAGANCSIHGHFAPTAGGALTASITITDSAASSPQSITLSGTGVLLPVTLSATSLTFPATAVGSASSSQSVTITNTGTAALSFTSIAVTGVNASSFVFANSCGTSLAVGANCTIHGHFAPITTGALKAAITITDSAAGSPQSIALSGTGQ